MSSLESQAKPILVPLLSGEGRDLSAEEQTVLARWSLKLSILAHADRGGQDAFTSEFMTNLVDGNVPHHCWVWLARYCGEQDGWVDHRAIRYISDAGAGSRYVACTTLTVQQLAIQTVVADGSFSAWHLDVERPYIVRIAGTSARAAIWPPPLTVTDETLELFSSPFGEMEIDPEVLSVT